MSDRKNLFDMLCRGVALGACSVLTVELINHDLRDPPYRLSWGAIGLLIALAVLAVFTFRKIRKSPP